MGAILAVCSAAGGEVAQAKVVEMAEASAYRGSLQSVVHGSLALGVQSLGWDGSMTEDQGLVIAVHGYVVAPGAGLDRFMSAAEIVAAFWQEQGPQSLRKLDGEFALVVADTQSGELYAACSIGGTRPLFFSVGSGELAVATEVRQVRAALAIEPELDELNLVRMLASRPVSAEGTLDRRVSRVYPSRAYQFQVGAPEQPPRTSTFWEPPVPAQGPDRWSFAESASRLRDLLADVVGDAIPDEPWALSLSGGRDSTALWALAHLDAAKKGSPFGGRSVSLEFPGMACDERHYIEATLAKFPGPRPLWINAAVIDPILPSLELAPRLDTVLFPTTYFADLAASTAVADGRSIFLTGNGGDEWLGGASLSYLRQELLSGRWLEGLKGYLGYELPDGSSRSRFVWNSGIRPLVGGAVRRLGLGRDQAPEWISDGGWKSISESEKVSWLDTEKGPVRAGLARQLHLRRTSFEIWALEQVVAQRKCEVRLPLMHRRVIDFAFEVPPEHVIAGVREKHLLRAALEGAYPESIEERRVRTYFSEPFESRSDGIADRLRQNEWALTEMDCIDERGVMGLIDRCEESSALQLLLRLYMADRFVAT